MAVSQCLRGSEATRQMTHSASPVHWINCHWFALVHVVPFLYSNKHVYKSKETAYSLKFLFLNSNLLKCGKTFLKQRNILVPMQIRLLIMSDTPLNLSLPPDLVLDFYNIAVQTTRLICPGHNESLISHSIQFFLVIVQNPSIIY